MIEIGLTLPDAIQRISNAKLGLLSWRLAIVSRDVSTGAYINAALVRMEERIGLVSVKRAISLLVKASEITSNLREIFVIAITDFEHYLKLRSERANTAIVYVMIIYLSFGIYLYTAYQLNGPFMSSFSSFNLNFNIADNVREMFDIGVILGLFSGIMAGQFSSTASLPGSSTASPFSRRRWRCLFSLFKWRAYATKKQQQEPGSFGSCRRNAHDRTGTDPCGGLYLPTPKLPAL